MPLEEALALSSMGVAYHQGGDIALVVMRRNGRLFWASGDPTWVKLGQFEPVSKTESMLEFLEARNYRPWKKYGSNLEALAAASHDA